MQVQKFYEKLIKSNDGCDFYSHNELECDNFFKEINVFPAGSESCSSVCEHLANFKLPFNAFISNIEIINNKLKKAGFNNIVDTRIIAGLFEETKNDFGEHFSKMFDDDIKDISDEDLEDSGFDTKAELAYEDLVDELYFGC